jgi:hypothetical protein
LDPRYAENHFSEVMSMGACWYEKSPKSWEEDPLLKVKGIVEDMLIKLGVK